MKRALKLAQRGQGHVEPNPMVGCVITNEGRVIGEGWHQEFGGPHAEVVAIRNTDQDLQGATIYVNLEPCCHHGKTPPCTDQIIAAGIRRVVIAQSDPYHRVNGHGATQLSAAGIDVKTRVLEDDARRLNLPYHKLLRMSRPWVIAKWAMTLDGKIASHTGSSRWISGTSSRAIVHALRGRVDAILIGRETARRDDPLLTARPPGPRRATRIVLDSQARLSIDSQLVKTAHEVPVLVVTGPAAPPDRCRSLADSGCELFHCQSTESQVRVEELLSELGRRRMTNVLAEGGGHILGCLFDLAEIDEIQAFIAPKLIGGDRSPVPLRGKGISEMLCADQIEALAVQRCDSDIHVSGIISH